MRMRLHRISTCIAWCLVLQLAVTAFTTVGLSCGSAEPGEVAGRHECEKMLFCPMHAELTANSESSGAEQPGLCGLFHSPDNNLVLPPGGIPPQGSRVDRPTEYSVVPSAPRLSILPEFLALDPQPPRTQRNS
jgi:hypothetical protein